jgi:hypothetical protein
MDEEISEIVIDFEQLAAADAEFERRWRGITRSGYVLDMIRQCRAREFSFVGEIPQRVAEKKIVEAEILNDAALQAFEQLDTKERKIVLKNEGVSEALLQGNAALLTTILTQPEG